MALRAWPWPGLPLLYGHNAELAGDLCQFGVVPNGTGFRWGGEGGMAAARRRMWLRHCPARTGFESPYRLGENTKGPEWGLSYFGGEGGIRTHDRLLTYAGFQDQCIQPLCHLSRFSCIKAPQPSSHDACECMDSSLRSSPFGRSRRGSNVQTSKLVCQPLCHLSGVRLCDAHCAG